MIWIALIAAALVGGGAFLFARTWRGRAVLAASLAAGVGVYWMLGRPGVPDQPLASRVDTIEAKVRTGDLSGLTGEQLMAVAQKGALDNPQAPGPYMAMGMLLEEAGRFDEAMFAYQSALRRDEGFADALKALADLRFQTSGEFDEATTELYHRAFARMPDDLRIGYMAAVGDWRAGRKAEAEAAFAAIEARTQPGDPRLEMFKALREAFAPKNK
jgi:cytochrome c-type biogenesis protein CcmH/NrfG